jgi:hypothetical protein
MKRKQHLELRSKSDYMRKREMGWHILYYNLRREIEYKGNKTKECLSFYFFKIRFYLIPDRADHP